MEKDKELKEHVSIKVEYEPDVKNVKNWGEVLEYTLRVVITFKVNVEMVPRESLGRYVMKKQRLIDLCSEENRVAKVALDEVITVSC